MARIRLPSWWFVAVKAGIRAGGGRRQPPTRILPQGQPLHRGSHGWLSLYGSADGHCAASADPELRVFSEWTRPQGWRPHPIG